MGRFSRYCGDYRKDNSPKAREILRLAQMVLQTSDASVSPLGARWTIKGPLWIEQKKESSTIDSVEIWSHYTYANCTFPGHNHPVEPQKSRMYLKAIIYSQPMWNDSIRSHIVFYAKWDSDLVLRALHNVLPLEALAYYGRTA